VAFFASVAMRRRFVYSARSPPVCAASRMGHHVSITKNSLQPNFLSPWSARQASFLHRSHSLPVRTTISCRTSFQLTPSGAQSNPAIEPLDKPFTLIAVEDRYTGEFTADATEGTCWVVQTPIVTGGAWTGVPQGAGCGSGEAAAIQVTDQKGNSATTFIK